MIKTHENQHYETFHASFNRPNLSHFQSEENNMQMRFNLPGTARITTRQVSSLQHLALSCSILHWWKTESPARHLTVQLVNIMHTLKKANLLPRPAPHTPPRTCN